MNKKLTALILGLATSGLVSHAQDNNPPAPPPADNVKPAEAQPVTSPVVEAPAVTPIVVAQTSTAIPVAARENTPAPAAGGGVAKPDETVPLIVIDDVPLTDAIRNLARQSALNFQFDPRVTTSNQPNVSIRFENVSAQEALLAVLDNYSLVLAKDSKSKIARVTIKDPKAEDPLVARIVQLKYSEPTNLASIVKTTLSGRSTVVADSRTSQLIINTTEKEVEGVMKLITTLDSATKQVLIEAKLIETTKAPSSIKGIDWSGTLAAQQFQFGNNTQIKPQTDGESDNKPLATQWPKMMMDTAKGFNPATAFLNADGVSAVLSFLNKDTDTEVVATPRAVTLDNQMATLSVTRAFPIFSVTPGSANSPAGASVTYTNLGAILYVTPRIAADNNVSLKVIPEVSNIDGVDRQILNGTANTANIYAIRRIETSVMIPSGSTLVMGGMVNDTRSKSFTKVPVLGDIPFLGLAFRKEGKIRNKQNLLIFVTPTIVDDGDYQVNTGGRVFLQSRPTETPEPKESAWDSGKPHDWTQVDR